MSEFGSAPSMAGYGTYDLAANRKTSYAHPAWRYGLLFGLVNGLFALLQVAFSSYAAIANHAAITSLAYGLQNGGFQPNTLIRWLAPVATAAYGSCLLGFAVSMWLCWHAGRAAATAAQRMSPGAGAGLLASAIGSACWILGSVVAVSVLHTDATITGMLATTPDYSTANLGGELFGLLGQEVLAGLLALGFGALAGRSGANRARVILAPAPVPSAMMASWQTLPPAGVPAGYASLPGAVLLQGAYPPPYAYPAAPYGYVPLPGVAYPPQPGAFSLPPTATPTQSQAVGSDAAEGQHTAPEPPTP